MSAAFVCSENDGIVMSPLVGCHRLPPRCSLREVSPETVNRCELNHSTGAIRRTYIRLTALALFALVAWNSAPSRAASLRRVLNVVEENRRLLTIS